MQYVVAGVVTGSFLIIATLGFALISRSEQFLNIAHAELLSVAALATWFLSVEAGLPFLLAAAIAVVGTAGLGLLVARVIYDPIRARGAVILLITSVGVVFLIQGIIESIVTPGVRSFDIPRVRNWDLGLFSINVYQLIVIALAVVSVVGLHLFLTRTRTGMSIRAYSDNRELAAARRIPVRTVTRSVWLVATGLAGVAGIALGILGTITIDIAFEQILLILSVSILAGVGSIYGVVASAMIVGLAMDISVQWISGGYRTAVAFLIIIVVLVFRPQGLSGVVRS